MPRMISPVCPVCGGPFGACPCNGQGKPKGVLVRMREREPEIRPWLGLVEFGCALILVGALLMLVV